MEFYLALMMWWSESIGAGKPPQYFVYQYPSLQDCTTARVGYQADPQTQWAVCISGRAPPASAEQRAFDDKLEQALMRSMDILTEMKKNRPDEYRELMRRSERLK